MNNIFVASARHMLLLAVFWLIGFTEVWSQVNNLKNSHVVSSEPTHLWKNEPFGDFDLTKEVLERRDGNSKHFLNANGTYTAHVAAGDIHYEENGQWKTIYHTIVPSGNGFENLTNNHKTWYPATSLGLVKTILKDGSELRDMIGMRMYYEVNGQVVQSQNIQSKPGKANFNELTYSNVYGNGIDLKLTQHTKKRKMDYIINNRSAINNIPVGASFLIFEESAELPEGWKAILRDNEILLADASGKTRTIYEKPIFRDTPIHHHHENEEAHEHNAHEQEFREYKIMGTYAIEQIGNKLIIKTKVPLNWLTSAERSFPIIIDPTADYYPDNANWETGTIESAGVSGGWISAANGSIDLGKFGSSVTNGWAKFNLTSNCYISQINSVNMFYNVSTNFSSETVCTVPIRIRRLANNPVTATFPDLLTDIRNDEIFQTTDLAVKTAATGWRSTPLSGNLNTLQNMSINGWISVGFEYFQITTPHADCYNYVDGHPSANRPYLRIDYNNSTCSLAQETNPSLSAASACNDGSFRAGSGAFYDLAVEPNTYYAFTWNNNAAANINGFCATPQNGTGASFSSNQTLWFSGTTNLLRVSASRSSCTWSGTSGIMTYRNATPDAPTASGAGTYCFPANLTATLPANMPSMPAANIYWQNSALGQVFNQGSGLTKNVTSTGSWWARAYNNGCWSNASAQQSVTIGSPGTAPSDANQWSVSAYWGSNFDYISGFYTDTRTSFATTDRWTNTPSEANNTNGLAYSGCTLPNDAHSYIYNRKGFDCKRYQINITGHDDHIRVKVDQDDNGVFEFNQLYTYDGLGKTNIWSGNLYASSRVIIEVQEFTGNSLASVDFVDVSPAVTVNLPAANCINTSFNLSATGSFAFTSYSWSGNGVSNVNSSTTTATPAASGSQSYTVVAGIGNGCTVSDTKNLTVNARPVPTFIAPTTNAPNPAAQVCKGQNVVYTTQTGGGVSNYSWNIQGSSGSSYTIVGGNTNSNSVTLQWLTTGDKTVTVNYTDNNTCVGASPASNTQNVTFPVAPTLDTKSP